MSQLQQALAELLHSPLAVLQEQGVSGGCISDARRVRVRTDDGRECDYFVKSNGVSFLDNFHAEWDGLDRLAGADAIAVPRPIAVGSSGGRAWLVLEWVDQGSASTDYFETFGRQLARLHQVTEGNEIGLPRNNFLGSATQINTPCDRWPEFVAQHRIGYQLRWATDQGLADSQLQRDVAEIVERMDELLAGSEPSTALLHGDLWSGNYLCGADGQPVLIDPAVYYGNREAEFGMLKLFGSCPPRFYDAYDETFPFAQGWGRRVNVYVLYHLLNHLNLFGRGYHHQCCSVAAEILRG
jgi:fructosamine-3-kinase